MRNFYKNLGTDRTNDPGRVFAGESRDTAVEQRRKDMSDFTIGHVTDQKEGPMDGVYAETKGTYTKFKGTGAFQKEKRILYQKVTDVGIKASLQTGMVSINDRNRNQAIAVSITEMVAILNEALRYGTAGMGKKVRL